MKVSMNKLSQILYNHSRGVHPRTVRSLTKITGKFGSRWKEEVPNSQLRPTKTGKFAALKLTLRRLDLLEK